MRYRSLIVSSLASLSFLLGLAVNTPAQMSHDERPAQPNEFRRIEQPLWVKVIVTGAGVSLMGVELWWFLLSKPTSHAAEIPSRITSNHRSR